MNLDEGRQPRRLLPEDLRGRMGDLAAVVAERLRDPDADKQIVDRPDNTEPIFGASMWSPGSMSHGLAGTSLMYSLFADSDSHYRELSHRHLQRAVQSISWSARDGLMGGPAGIMAAAQGVSGAGTQYRGLREKLTEWIVAVQAKQVREYAETLRAGVHWFAYDFMNGITGVLRVLIDEASPEAREAVRISTDYLCSHILRKGDSGLPGWWVPAKLEPVEQDRLAYPHGDLNLGMAHGVTGVVATLTTVAERNGLTPDVEDAVRGAVEWMLAWRQKKDGIPYWPARIPAELDEAPREAPPLFTRAAWCYGTPGVALTLMRAGRLLGDPAVVDTAVDTLAGHLQVPEPGWRLDGPTFCHGLAGTLHVLHRAWRLCGDERLRRLAEAMAARLVDDDMAEAETPFLFRHWVPDSPDGWQKADSYKKLDSIGLLEGASGVAAVLYSLSEASSHDMPAWDRVFGLS